MPSTYLNEKRTSLHRFVLLAKKCVLFANLNVSSFVSMSCHPVYFGYD